MKAGGEAGEQAKLGCSGFEACVGKAMFDDVVDGLAVHANRAGKLYERLQLRARSPSEPVS